MISQFLVLTGMESVINFPLVKNDKRKTTKGGNMKTLLLSIAMLIGTSAFAAQQQGVIFVNATDEASIQRAVSQINNGTYPGYFNDTCSGRRRVYAVELTNGGYRVDRYGNVIPTAGKAVIKYRCNGGRD